MNRSTLLLILCVFACSEALLAAKRMAEMACTDDEITNIWYTECHAKLREMHTVDGKDTRTYCRKILDHVKCGHKLISEKCGVEAARKTLRHPIKLKIEQGIDESNPECKEVAQYLSRIALEPASTTTPEPTTTPVTTTPATTTTTEPTSTTTPGPTTTPVTTTPATTTTTEEISLSTLNSTESNIPGQTPKITKDSDMTYTTEPSHASNMNFVPAMIIASMLVAITLNRS